MVTIGIRFPPCAKNIVEVKTTLSEFPTRRCVPCSHVAGEWGRSRSAHRTPRWSQTHRRLLPIRSSSVQRNGKGRGYLEKVGTFHRPSPSHCLTGHVPSCYHFHSVSSFALTV